MSSPRENRDRAALRALELDEDGIAEAMIQVLKDHGLYPDPEADAIDVLKANGYGVVTVEPKLTIAAGGPLNHSILNDLLIDQFCELIEDGLAADSVCNYIGIAPSTFWTWLRKGTLYLNGGESPPELRGYGVFVRRFRQSTAKYLHRIGMNLHTSEKSWFRELEILSRRDRRTWSRDEPAGGSDDQFDPDERFL